MNHTGEVNIQQSYNEDGVVYFAKGHIPFDIFVRAVSMLVDIDDPILKCKPMHVWMRACRNFKEEAAMYIETKPESRGAFKCTWLQLN